MQVDPRRAARSVNLGCSRTCPGSGPRGRPRPGRARRSSSTSAGVELEVEDLEVLAHPLGRHRLREDDVAALDVPAQDDLRWRLADARRRSRRAPRRRGPCPARSATSLGHDAVLACRTRDVLVAGSTGGPRSGSPPARRPVSATSRSRCADLEVRDADRPRPAVLLELLERLPRRHEVAVVERRQRPVDEEQVDVVEAELRRASPRTRGARRRAGGSRC